MVLNSEAFEQGDAADAVDAADAADTACGPRGRIEAAAPFRRPRGRGPPGCTWDVLKGGWFRADGSAWQRVRNEKRDLARAARRLAKKEERWAERRARSEQANRNKAIKAEERLQLKEEACKAREAAVAARDARARLVRFDGETVYCAKHLCELDIVQQDGDSCAAHAMCGACVELGWRDVRRAPPPAALLPPAR